MGWLLCPHQAIVFWLLCRAHQYHSRSIFDYTSIVKHGLFISLLECFDSMADCTNVCKVLECQQQRSVCQRWFWSCSSCFNLRHYGSSSRSWWLWLERASSIFTNTSSIFIGFLFVLIHLFSRLCRRLVSKWGSARCLFGLPKFCFPCVRHDL